MIATNQEVNDEQEKILSINSIRQEFIGSYEMNRLVTWWAHASNTVSHLY